MHKSVLLNEALLNLAIKNGGTYVDATFGAGGYTKAILQSAECNVIAFDRDDSVIPIAEQIKNEFGLRFTFINDKFSNIANYVTECDGIVADFGISSMHVDNASRGFSFQKEAKLDMQMGKCDISAYDVINTFSEKQIADIIFHNSNERLAKKIAGMVVNSRKKSAIDTTIKLAQICFEAYGRPQRYKIHPATKTFQAIRMYVNKELEEIHTLLKLSIRLIKPQGRLVCVSFHELEDRIVKNFLIEHSEKKVKNNKYSNHDIASSMPFQIITNKPVESKPEEVQENPRARSAKLRVAEKVC